jgi:hypothetical protein
MLSILCGNPVSITFAFSFAVIAMLANAPVLHQYTAENTNHRRPLFALDDLRKFHHTAQGTNTRLAIAFGNINICSGVVLTLHPEGIIRRACPQHSPSYVIQSANRLKRLILWFSKYR